MLIRRRNIANVSMNQNESNIIIHNTIDGKASVALYAHDGSVWMNRNQLTQLF